MRRSWLGVALAAALLLPAATASAKSFTLPAAKIDARVARDGAILVRESITFDYQGAFTGAYREIPLRAGERIDRISVSEGGRRYARGGSVALGTEGRASQFGARVVGTRMRIVWRYRAADETRTYTVRYRISGLARAYDDVVDVNLQVWGSTWETGLRRLDATLTAPRRVTAGNARVYGHPASVRGETAFAGGAARLRALDVPARQFVELRLLFPRSALTSTARAQVVDGAGGDRIAAEEAAGAAAYAGDRGRLDSALDHLPRTLLVLLVLGVGPAAAILVLAWLAFSRERPDTGYDREYEQEPPSDDPPALIAPLLRQSTTPGPPEFTATLFELIRRGCVTAQPTTTKKGKPDLMLSLKGRAGSPAPLESGVARIVERALGSGPLRLSELSDRIRSGREKNAPIYSAWQRKVTKELERRRWYDHRGATVIAVAAGVLAVVAVALAGTGLAGLASRGVGWDAAIRLALAAAAALNAAVLAVALRSERLRRRWTPAAAIEAARWNAFRRYLRDFPRLHEAPPASLVLWERLLVYGIAFGLADRVLEAAKVAAPQALRDQSTLYAPGYEPGGGSFYSAPVSNGLSRSLAPGPSGADSGGSSLSGGGGTGGGGGGGGAW